MIFLPTVLLAAAAAAAAAAAPAPPADAARIWAVAPGSTITYRLVHKFHAVEGVSRSVEGRARLGADGALQAAVRARVDSFDSGNSNRDVHMMEVTEAARLPFVVLKAVAAGIRAEPSPDGVDVPLRAALEFHGVTRELSVTARVRFTSPDRAEVRATFPVSLTEHGVERPALLFVKVDDRIEIEARLVLEAAPP